MSRLSWLELITEVLGICKEPMTSEEIWKKAKEFGLDKGIAGKTPWSSIGARIYTDIKDNGESSIFLQVSKKPPKFALKENWFGDTCTPITLKSSESSSCGLSDDRECSFRERDLHKILTSFVYFSSHFKCYSKTINHEVSSKGKKGENEWLHPDIVGVHYPFDDFSDETRKLMASVSQSNCKLFSFELKVELGFSTLREYFFQAVSNSSWANEGYLVALKYDDDPDFVDELRRLNSAFGIGFIKLNSQDYKKSEILFSARENELDWNTIDRLRSKNADFRDFVHRVSADLKGEEVHNPNFFDKVFTSDDEFQKYIEEKHIN
ncbi:HrgA protein [bacterium]|nr:HrgA protein [bacterium]